MKWMIAALLIAPSAFAAEACLVNDTAHPVGSSAVFYLEDSSAKVGPAYTCKEISRIRTCEVSAETGRAQWSERQPECGTFDSGGCVDWWLEQLNDSAFTHSTCR